MSSALFSLLAHPLNGTGSQLSLSFFRILSLTLCLSFLACEEGTLLENMPPDTRIFLDDIKLSGTNRLNSVVRLHWSGEDVDGYVQKFELSYDAVSWFPTTRTDSVFRFDIAKGSDTTDIDFYVRAIDNVGAVDPMPAYLQVPIKNAAPVAKLDTVNVIPDVVFAAWSVFYTVDDLDGFETLDSTFVKINDGAWLGIDKNIDFLTFVASASDQAGDQLGDVYSGLDGRLLAEKIEGLKVGENNQLYLRARDISGTLSEIDSSKTFFLRQRQSDLLVIDAHGADAADAVYFPILEQVYAAPDYLNLRADIPPFWAPTFGFILAEYDKVFWYSDGAELAAVGQQLLMEVAANQIQGYLNQGGKLMMSARFPNSFNDPAQKGQSLVFGFSPMDSLSSSAGQARLPSNNAVFPIGNQTQTYDTLFASAFLTGVDAFYPKDPANEMFAADLVPVGGWTGPRTLIARSLFTNGKTNQVFVGVELHKLDQNPAALAAFFSQVLNVEFDW